MVRRRLFVLASLVSGVVAVAALVPAAFGTGAASKVSVTATDFKFKIVPAQLKAGANTITVVNRGEATHDFKIANKKTRILNPGQRQTLTVTLKKGRYTVLCTVPGHASLGMKNTLVVK
jgi:uncharacterized cupredoxin-like copper-binding protein